MYAAIDSEGIVMGFYDEGIHGDAIPNGVIEITEATHGALLEGQTQGKRMKVNADGSPELVDPPPPLPPSMDDVARARRLAYADPDTGSDRFFAEATRLRAAGDNAGAQAAEASGEARYEAIRADLPWPKS